MSVKMKGGQAKKWNLKFDELKRMALERDISTNDLCEMSGVNRGLITHWVTHQQVPRVSNWNKIQKVLAELPVKFKEQGALSLQVYKYEKTENSVSPVFDDEPTIRKAPIETEAEREAKVTAGSQPARDVLTQLIVAQLGLMDITELAITLGRLSDKNWEARKP
jgi:hypothetical protein